jgi:hypothetical protein
MVAFAGCGVIALSRSLWALFRRRWAAVVGAQDCLAGIELTIGASDHLVQCFTRGELRHSDAKATVRKAVHEDLSNVSKASPRVREPRIRQTTHKLVTAVPDDDVVRAKSIAQRVTDGLQ